MKIIEKQKLDEALSFAKKRKEEILNAKSQYEIKGTVYYLDSETGDNEADGLSPETAWRSMQRLSSADLKAGDVVLFRRGQTFRGTMKTVSGVTYSAYGEGKKPELISSINAADPNMWVPTRWKNVWMYVNMISYVRDIGGIAFDEGKCWGIKVYINHKTNERVDMFRSNGDRSEHRRGELDVFNGRNWIHRECTVWNGPQDLKNDLEFYHDWSDEHLYLYCEGNPAKQFSSIELFVRCFIIRNAAGNNDVTIDNLGLKYAGIHAISSGSCKNFTVRNCEISFIGGSQMAVEQHKSKAEKISYGNDPTRLGNAIEIYGLCENYLCENNYIHQIYDTGITVQYQVNNLDRDYIMKDVVWRNNLLDLCHWSLELWLYSPEKEERNNDFKTLVKNVDIHDNICLNNGYGWGRQRPDQGDVCFTGGGGNGTKNTDYENYSIRNNMFLGTKCAIISSIAFGEEGIKVFGNKIYGDSSIGNCGSGMKFGVEPRIPLRNNDETIEALEKSGWWYDNEVLKLTENEKSGEEYFKI